jgi:uncharacterized protein YigA (DUF484 family)
MNADDVILFLGQHPDFFRHRPRLFTDMLLPDPHEGRAISLADRQSALLRERVRVLEERLDELMQIGRENDHLMRILIEWTGALLTTDDRLSRRHIAIEKMQALFGIPVMSIRTWGKTPDLEQTELARFVGSLDGPTCGQELPIHLLDSQDSTWGHVQSTAWIPLRRHGSGADTTPAEGVLALGSPDADRFHGDLGTAILERIGEIASAALLLPVPHTPTSAAE